MMPSRANTCDTLAPNLLSDRSLPSYIAATPAEDKTHDAHGEQCRGHLERLRCDVGGKRLRGRSTPTKKDFECQVAGTERNNV